MYLEKSSFLFLITNVSKSIQNHPLVAQIVLMYPKTSGSSIQRLIFWGGNVLAAIATNDYSIASLVGLTAVTFSLRIFARSQRRQQQRFSSKPQTSQKKGLLKCIWSLTKSILESLIVRVLTNLKYDDFKNFEFFRQNM